jgi:hypothetical protein
MVSMEIFPDIILSILEFLPTSSLWNTLLVNKTWNRISHHAYLWKDIEDRALEFLYPNLINPHLFQPRITLTEGSSKFLDYCHKIEKLVINKESSLSLVAKLATQTCGLQKLFVLMRKPPLEIYQLINRNRLTLQMIYIRGRLLTNALEVLPNLRSLQCRTLEWKCSRSIFPSLRYLRVRTIWCLSFRIAPQLKTLSIKDSEIHHICNIYQTSSTHPKNLIIRISNNVDYADIEYLRQRSRVELHLRDTNTIDIEEIEKHRLQWKMIKTASSFW